MLHDMNHQFTIADTLLLKPTGLRDSDLEKILSGMMSADVRSGIDTADLYFQNTRSESWVLEGGIVKDGSFGINCGVGIRAISGEKTGFSYSNDLSYEAIQNAADAAKSVVKAGKSGCIAGWTTQLSPAVLYEADNPMQSVTKEQKVDLLRQIDQLARAKDARITQVTVSLIATHDVVLIAASDGTLAADVRPMVRFNVAVIAEENGRRERGGSGYGGRFSLQALIHGGPVSTVKSSAATPVAISTVSIAATITPASIAEEAVRAAIVNLEAQPAPAGAMPVVLGAGWPGVLLHEAVGHGLEGDFNHRGCSAFAGRVGEKVASPLCTVVDDGTIPARRGSLSIDDEGVPTQNTVLIENGILKGYMQDKLNGRLMGQSPTGNGRRQSYRHLPLPRMTNTYMLAGESDPDEIIASVEKGLYAKNLGGGQVDITSGKFVFSTSEVYLIEKGKVTCPVKGATLIGNGPEVMQRVTMVGNDLELDYGVGTCGKEGQSVPVGVGQPTLKISEITVGGTQG